MTSGAHTSGNEENPVTEVISIKFRGRGKTYYFDPAGVTARTGDTLVVETSKGMELGECVKGNHMVGDGDCVQPLRPVVRRATPDDLRIAELNRKREKEALGICRELIEKHKLEMKLVDVECSFEGNKILFFFTADGRVDYEALGRMIDYVIEGGADYIVALGTTAETPTLYIQERAVVAMFIANQIRHRVPLVIGVGGNSTSEVLDQLREFDLRSADAILSVTPYYNKPSQEGLYQHFKVVSEHSPLPIILYNIAGRTGVNMTAETTLRIAGDFENVIGIKEASGNIAQIQEIIDRRCEGFLVLSGDDGIAVDVMRRGGDGVISVAVNAFPRKMMTCIDLAKKGDFEGAHKAYECLEEAVTALFAEGNPTGVKCAMSVLGLIGNTLRLPLVPGTPQLEARFKELIAKYDLN